MPVHRQTPEQIERARLRRKQVGARLRELRLERGLTQEALAHEAGLDRTMILHVEWGRSGLTFDRLWGVADVLAVDIVDLFAIPGQVARRRVSRGGRRKPANQLPEIGDPSEKQ